MSFLCALCELCEKPCLSLRLCAWFIVVKFYLRKLAENYHVREWAANKLVGAHDNFSAGYKHDITHLNMVCCSHAYLKYFSFNEKKIIINHCFSHSGATLSNPGI